MTGVARRTLLAQGATTRTACVVDAAGTITGVEKRLLPRLLGDGLARAALDAEARVLEALGGRGAPRLLARGQDEGGPWLLMEHVALPTLASRIIAVADRAAFARLIARPALHALARVHGAADAAGPLSVVHGDLSPDNLLVGDSPPDARLIDFGLARFRDTRTGAASFAPEDAGGALRGTPRYVAPEVARGAPATVGSDLFALGLTLLHAASGEPPRSSASLPALVLEAGDESVLPYAERASGALPSRLREVLLAMVAFEPELRPASAREALAGGSW